MAVLGKHTRSLQALHTSIENSNLEAEGPLPHDTGRSFLEDYLWQPATAGFRWLSEKTAPKDQFPDSADDLPKAEDISLGTAKFGKASLQCNLIQSRSQWGKLEGHRAGVLDFSMTVEQRNDAKVKWARFDVIFKEYKDGTQAPAIFLDYLVPSPLPGRELVVDTKSRTLIDPQVEVAGGPAKLGLKGYQHEKSENMAKIYYWTLTSCGKTVGDSNRINGARWVWQANERVPQAPTKTLRSGAAINSVVEGDFEIELRLECRLMSRIQETGKWVRKRFWKKDVLPKTQVHSSEKEKDLLPIVDILRERISLLNEAEQLLQ
jgi:hypothetical protein